jgi:hypothetical protein
VTRASIAWNVTETTPPCFFFSGPEQLGRDDHLGEHGYWIERGGRFELSFGPGITFGGERTREGVTLSRRSVHDFEGKWVATETLRLERRDGAWIGTYGYTECEVRAPETCPGHCVVTASVQIDTAR